MDWGLFLTIVNAILVALAAYLGAKLSIDPVKAQKLRRRYRLGFICLGVIGVVITIALQVLQQRSEAKLQGQLAEIMLTARDVREQTKNPPQVSVNIPAPVIMPAAKEPANTDAVLAVLDARFGLKASDRDVSIQTRLKNFSSQSVQVRKIALRHTFGGVDRGHNESLGKLEGFFAPTEEKVLGSWVKLNESEWGDFLASGTVPNPKFLDIHVEVTFSQNNAPARTLRYVGRLDPIVGRITQMVSEMK